MEEEPPFGNESCEIYSKVHPDLSNSYYFIIPFTIIYVTIFILGIAGNSALIYVTLKHRTLQTVQNMFILNLAASDIIVCLLSLPITPVTNVYKNWFFGGALCRLIPCVQGVSIFICTFSLGAIAVDRYILVVRPHAAPLTKRGALVVTTILWTLSVVVTLPYAVFMVLEDYPGICGVFCTEKWPNTSSRRAYTMVVMTAQFVAPFVLMAFCYATIFSRLRSRARVRLRKLDARSIALEQSTSLKPPPAPSSPCGGQTTNGDQMGIILDQQERERQRLLNQTRRTTLILVSMVVIFGLTYLPQNLVSIMIEYDNEQNFFHLFGRADLDIAYLINLFTHSIAMTNNISNPVLYAWLNPTFRELVIQTLFRRHHMSQSMKSRTIITSAVYKDTSSMRRRSLSTCEKSQNGHTAPLSTISNKKKNLVTSPKKREVVEDKQAVLSQLVEFSSSDAAKDRSPSRSSPSYDKKISFSSSSPDSPIRPDFVPTSCLIELCDADAFV